MNLTKDAHEHTFLKQVLIKVVADNPQFIGEPMGILARKCKCGKLQPWEYGKRQSMEKLLERITDEPH